MERLVDFKISALSVLGYLGSISAPDRATILEAHALHCITAGPCNAIPTNFLRAGSTCGLGLDIFGIFFLSLAARYRTAVNSGTLANGLEKVHAARGHDHAPMLALTSEWTEKSSRLQWLTAPWRPSNMCATSTTLLRDEIQHRNFAIPIAMRVSRAFGPVSSHLTAQILPQMCLASRASRPGLAVGLLRVRCNGMCTAQRFHIEGEEQGCRAGCQDEPGSTCSMTLLPRSSSEAFNMELL